MNIKLTKPIGDGRFADVWAGTDEIDRQVAVKVLREEGKDVSTIIQYAKALVRCNHPNVVDVYSVETLDVPNLGEEKCIVMERIEGITLADKLKDELDLKTAFKLGSEILAGITHIHDQGLVHMDLHDENILIESDGNVKIIDIMYLSSLSSELNETQESRFKHDKRQLISILQEICDNSPLGENAKTEFSKVISIDSTLSEISISFHNVFTLVSQGIEYMIDDFRINPVTAKFYKFRAECEPDVNSLLEALGSNVISVKKSKQYFPDSYVELITSLSLEELRDQIRTLEDGHVMLQTIQPHYNYTGERDYNLH
ncbi:MAG: protein kinase [Desulfobacteraceae bacterium]|nr:protein kinase [Desulfobacteraceae bacterium]